MFSHLATVGGWRRKALAFALGVCATLTLAPFYVFPLIVPAYGGLFMLVNAAPTRKAAFVDGWWWGWGFFMSGLYWFCIALLTDPEKFAWAIPLALFGLTGVIAFYPAVACALYKAVAKGGRLLQVYLFALVWLAVEYARGHLFTGFPWNLAGYAFGFSDVSLQSASLVGAYGLTFLTLLLAVCSVSGKRLALVAWAVFFVSFGWGYIRLQHAGEGEPSGARIRIVQANVSQPHNWDPKRQFQALESYMRLTQAPGIERVTHVIWPESATPYFLEPDSTLAKRLGAILPPGAILLTGALHKEDDGDDYRIYNSLVALDAEGNILGNYNKRQLVPFGEFLPLRDFIPSGWNLPVGNKDFSRGGEGAVLNWHGIAPFVGLICYEAIFPDMAESLTQRPAWLLTVTNDVWFGQSTGPRQHFEMARMRAVEQGLPLVRVANTGISAYIDEYGRVRERMSLNEKDVRDFMLQKSQLSATTYIRCKEYFVLLLIFLGLILRIPHKK